MKRLREAFLIACKQAEQGDVMLPLEFHYEEPESIESDFTFAYGTNLLLSAITKRHLQNIL